jgi:uncharacterized protein YcfL
MKLLWFLIIVLLISCTSKKEVNSNSVAITDKVLSQDVLTSADSKQTESNKSEQIVDPLILGGKPYVDFHGKTYRKDEAELFTSLVCDLRHDAVVRLYSLEGLEQLVNLKDISIYGENLDTVDFTPLSSLYNLEELFIRGNITRLPDLTGLKKLSSIGITYSRLESLKGIGAPNVKRINIENRGVRINSLAPLNNLPHLEYLTINIRGSTTLSIADMSNLPSLKNLRLLMPSTQIDLQGIEKLSAIEELLFSESNPFNIEGIGKLKNLRDLGLKLVSPEPSLEFLRNMPNLSDLGIDANIEGFDSSHNRRFEPYQVLDVSPLASLKNLRNLGCRNFIIKNISALDVLDALSIQDDESPGYIYLAGCRLYDETEKSKHSLVFEIAE